MTSLLEKRERSAVIEAAAKAIPAKLRPSAFAVVADLLSLMRRSIAHKTFLWILNDPPSSPKGASWAVSSGRVSGMTPPPASQSRMASSKAPMP
jgi:hypothetical protein